MPTIVPKSVQTCFEYVLGRFFRNSFFVQCSLEGRVVENFQKNQKFSKVQKCPKSLSKVSKRVLNMFRVNFFEKVYLPCVPCRVESSEIFKKIKNFSKLQKCPKSFPKVSKRVLNMFWVNFFENFFCPVFHGGSSLRKFSNKSKIFKKCKNARNHSQKCPNMF